MMVGPDHGAGKTVFRIDDMDCPTEENLIRAKLTGMIGVAALDFNLIQRRLTVTHSPEVLDNIVTALQAIGFEAKIESGNATAVTPQIEPVSKTNWWPLAFSGVAATLSEVVGWIAGVQEWAIIALALLAILSGGLPTYKKGWVALKNGNLNINALMSIAVTGAVAIGHWPEAAMVTFLFALAELIEAKSLDRARNAIRGLMELA
ncbi:cation transporter, partial [Hydrogenophaga sp.]